MPDVILEKAKKDKPKATSKVVLDIIETSNSKQEIISKLKAIDKGEGGTKWGDPGYMKKDICNALISACLGLPSFALAKGSTAALGLWGVLPGLLGLYLAGQIFHLRATKYDKFHLLEYYEKQIKRKKAVLEKAEKHEKDPKTKAEIQRRIKEANSCIKTINKERRKLIPKKVSDATSDDGLDDLNLDFDFDDDEWENWEDIELEESNTFIEASYHDKLYPVFIINIFNHERIGQVITKYLGDKYSHSCLSLDSSLREMYSFNGFDKFASGSSIDKKGFGGITIEDIEKYARIDPDTDINVLCFYVKEAEYAKLKVILSDYLNNFKNTRYDLLNIIAMAAKQPRVLRNRYNLVCSQFIDVVLKMCDITLIDEPSNLVTPGKLSRISNPNVYLVYEGKATDYNSKFVDMRLRKLSKKAVVIKEGYITESKQYKFKAEFEEEGNLIISKERNLSYEELHMISKKMYPVYKKQNNIDGMKYEACKLWYLNSLLVEKMNSTRKGTKKYDDMVELRSKILNEFTLYINTIESKDPNFNLMIEYQQSPFCKSEMKITKRWLRAILDSMKRVLIILS